MKSRHDYNGHYYDKNGVCSLCGKNRAGEQVGEIDYNMGVRWDYKKAEQKVDPEPQPTDQQQILNEVLRLVNAERAKVGASPLASDPVLQAGAAVRAGELTQLFDHTRPNGSKFYTVLKEVPGGSAAYYYTMGENIARGYPTAQSVVQGWMNSDGHRANILNTSFNRIGIGYDAPAKQSIANVRNTFLASVNQERRQRGLQPVTEDAALNAAADIRVTELRHSVPAFRLDGSLFDTALDEARANSRAQYYDLGENQRCASSEVAVVMEAWMTGLTIDGNSYPEHRNNILNPNFDRIGTSYDPKTGCWEMILGAAATAQNPYRPSARISGDPRSDNMHQLPSELTPRIASGGVIYGYSDTVYEMAKVDGSYIRMEILAGNRIRVSGIMHDKDDETNRIQLLLSGGKYSGLNNKKVENAYRPGAYFSFEVSYDANLLFADGNQRGLILLTQMYKQEKSGYGFGSTIGLSILPNYPYIKNKGGKLTFGVRLG